MALIKRITKGSPLTFAEGDANLDYLDNFIKQISSSYATTGSNTFISNQTIQGTLIVNGQTQTAGQFSGVQNGYVELSLQNIAPAPSSSTPSAQSSSLSAPTPSPSTPPSSSSF